MTHAPPPLPHACAWCGAAVENTDLACPRCGAPVSLAPRHDASGWTELPPIRELTRLRIGQSTCQIEGMYVPVADFNIAAGDSVMFSHHTLLWKDTAIEIRRMKMAGMLNRMLGGLPLIMTSAHGPGHIAFSRDEPGELIALPIRPNQHLHVREHQFLVGAGDLHWDCAQTGISFRTQNGNDSETHYPLGMFMDIFRAGDQPALLILHAAGNAFVRDLAPGQSMLIKPRALVYKDRSVQMGLHVEFPANYQFNTQRLMWLRLVGPGRVAIQSVYEPIEDNGRQISAMSTLPMY